MTLSFCTLNGSRVIRGSVTRGLSKAWYGDFVVDLLEAPALRDAIAIVFTGETGVLTLKGSAFRSRAYLDTTYVRVVGGKVLGDVLPAKWYRAQPISIIVKDLLAKTGLTLSSTSDAKALGKFLPYFTRPEATTGEILDLLTDEAESSWRILEDGSLFVGKPTWEETTLDSFELMSDNPLADRVEYALDYPQLSPGRRFTGRKILSVTDSVEVGKSRTAVVYGDG